MVQKGSRRRAGLCHSLVSRFVPWAEARRGPTVKLRNTTLGLLVIGAAAACGGETSTVLGHVSHAVLGGEASGTDQDGVVMLTMEQGEAWSICSATVVAPSIIVTAKHCVVAIQPGEFYCTGDGEPVDDGSGAGTFQQTPAPQTLSVYVGAVPESQSPVARGSAIFATESTHVCRDDVAVVVLDRPLDRVPVMAVGRDAALRTGQEVSVVGYGTQDPSKALERRVRRGVRILDIGALGPEDQREKPTTPPRTFTVEGGTVCFGDSGGPALDEADELVGILSRLSGDCAAEETRNTYMVAKSFLDLLDEAAASTSSLQAGADSDGGSAGARGDATSDTHDERLPAAGAPASSDPSQADGQPEPSSSSGAFRCQVSAGFSAGKASSSLVWAALTGLVLAMRRAFGGGARRGVRDG
jgi:hypothetical protein